MIEADPASSPILCLNCGSSSLKFALYRLSDGAGVGACPVRTPGFLVRLDPAAAWQAAVDRVKAFSTFRGYFVLR